MIRLTAPVVTAGLLLALNGGSATLQASELQVHIQNQTDQSPLGGALVLADWAGAPRALPLASPAAMRQRDKAFVPGTLVIPTGSEVEFPNEDTVRHHVYSFSPAKSFDLKLYAGKPEKPVNFPVSGVVTLGCNIHDNMRAHILVSDQPRQVVSDANGQVLLKDLPDKGTITLQLWHPDMPKDTPMPSHTLTLPSTGPVNLSLLVVPPKDESSSQRKFKRYTD